MLLHALWLLLVAATLVAGSMAAVYYSAEELSIAEHRLTAGLAHESAVEMVIHDLLVHGNGSPWAGEGVVTRKLEFDGRALVVSVQRTTGLVDALRADSRIWERLLARTAIAPNARPADAGNAPARPANYADLQAMLGLDHAAFARLYPHITLFSARAEPEWRYASPRLAGLLGHGRPAADARSAIADDAAPAVAGATFRVTVLPEGEPDAAAGTSTEFTLTGQLVPSHLLRSRRHIAGAALDR